MRGSCTAPLPAARNIFPLGEAAPDPSHTPEVPSSSLRPSSGCSAGTRCWFPSHFQQLLASPLPRSALALPESGCQCRGKKQAPGLLGGFWELWLFLNLSFPSRIIPQLENSPSPVSPSSLPGSEISEATRTYLQGVSRYDLDELDACWLELVNMELKEMGKHHGHFSSCLGCLQSGHEDF